MTFTFTLTPEKETRLQQKAARAGLPLDEYARRLLDRDADAPDPPVLTSSQEDPTLALFAQWDAEDATDDPEEIARRQREGDELLQALADNPISFCRVDIGEDGDTQDRAA